MKVFLVFVFATLGILLIVSALMPPLPIWLGGLIGILIFLGVGNLTTRFME